MHVEIKSQGFELTPALRTIAAAAAILAGTDFATALAMSACIYPMRTVHAAASTSAA
ncbi:MAG: hypothetical protein R3E34_11740 [Rhodocyclaceae bacterium]